MSARRVRWSSQHVAATLICAAALASFGLGLCQPEQGKATIVTTSPLKYAINQQATYLEGTILPGGDDSLQPVVENLEPGAPSVTYDVPLLDLPRPQGGLDAIQECPPIILTPARLAQLRRNHREALADGFDEQSWSDLVADLVGRPAAGKPGDRKGASPRAPCPKRAGPVEAGPSSGTCRRGGCCGTC